MEIKMREILIRENKGNDLLYGFCNKVENWLDKDYLSPQIWLIGRSYAASPQRRTYKKNKNGEQSKTELADKGDGTDAFFDDLATKLLDNPTYVMLIEKVKTLKGEQFNYKDNDLKHDLDILKDTTQSVITFNKILRETIKKIDNTDDDSLINFTSFSSKFLHFYVPEIFYIIDSVSNETLRGAFNKNAQKASIGDEDKTRYDDLLKDLTQQVHYYSDNTNEKNSGLEYIKHCCRAHVIACKLNGEVEKYKIQINPRAVDNYLLYYLSQQ